MNFIADVIHRGAAIPRFSRTAVFATLGLVFAFSPLARGVTLAWDPSTDPTVVGYFLYYGNQSGNFSHSINAGSATSATVTDLIPGQTYYFVATAYNAAGIQSVPSNQVVF